MNSFPANRPLQVILAALSLTALLVIIALTVQSFYTNLPSIDSVLQATSRQANHYISALANSH